MNPNKLILLNKLSTIDESFIGQELLLLLEYE